MENPQKKAVPVVAIKCMAYNHEAYIRDALEGFVMQKTDFPFVAVVHDDASTDNTAAIIREYATKYPHIIKPIYETENLYSKRDGTIDRIMREAVINTGAKYIALCEGDDYWTDPLKLQKQVDFLEAHPEYSLVFANAKLHYDTGLSEDTFPLERREYTALESYRHFYVPTPTVVYRKEVLDSPCYKQLSKIKRPVFGDLTLYMAASSIGKTYCLGDIVCGYRRLSSGATTYIYKHPYKHLKNRIAISNYFGEDFKNADRDKFVPDFIPLLSQITDNFRENLFFLSRIYWFAPVRCSKELLRIPKSIMKRLFLS